MSIFACGLFDQRSDSNFRRSVETVLPPRCSVSVSMKQHAFVKEPWSITQYTVYYVDVVRRDDSTGTHFEWTVYRRYQDFDTLFEDLKDEGHDPPELPPKRFLGNLDPDFLEDRKRMLAEWLGTVCEMDLSNENLRSYSVRNFLARDANMPPEGLQPTHLPIPDVTEEDFEKIKVLGKGSFGKVLLVKMKGTDKLYAMKSIKKGHIFEMGQVEHTRTEREVLAQIRHPFVVTMHYAFQSADSLFMVLDYCSGGELFFHLKRYGRFPENVAMHFAAELILAIEHLHKYGIVYRDLKPENILLDGSGHVKLVDFGLAKEGVWDARQGAVSICGSPEYVAPEVLLGQGHGKAVDWWSTGSLIYEMLTGLPAFYDSNRRKMFENILSADLSYPPYVSPDAVSLVQGLLTRDPDLRLGSADDGELRRHPFFRPIDWNALMSKTLRSPFEILKLSGITDTCNFEEQFTRMPVHSEDAKAVTISANGDAAEHDDFSNFSYIASHALVI
eukprot:Rmarinus@m.4511